MDSDTVRRGILSLLEPSVIEALEPDTVISPHQLERLAAYSLAVSALRQANALERLAAAVEFNPNSYNLLDAIKERS